MSLVGLSLGGKCNIGKYDGYLSVEGLNCSNDKFEVKEEGEDRGKKRKRNVLYNTKHNSIQYEL
jgi:hypothetical protein